MQVWEDTLQADPDFLVIHARGGWKGMEQEKDASQEISKGSLTNPGKYITAKFSEQPSWRFENLSGFKRMNLTLLNLKNERGPLVENSTL